MTVYICTKFHENILYGIKVIEQHFLGIFSTGHNSVKMLVELGFWFSKNRLTIVYIVQSFMKLF